MLVTITERVSDVRADVDAAHAPLCFSLLPEDDGAGFAYARTVAVAPAGRADGVAVVLGDDAVATDPVVIRVRENKAAGKNAAGPSTIEIRRKALPVLLRVDPATGSAVVVSRLPRTA